MSEIDARTLELFFEVQRGLPRQGPGDRGSTIKALSLCGGLPDKASILDIGCGPGMQTIALSEATSGNIIAVDNCVEYLEQLRQRLSLRSLSARVRVVNADMSQLGFLKQTFDLIWSEGAAYIMGVGKALASWRSLLRAHGYLAFSELVWLVHDPPRPVAEYFQQEYPAMTTVPSIADVIGEHGYELIGDFTLPDAAWWEDYYTPLEAKLPSLKAKYEGDPVALEVVARTEAEIEMRREFGTTYGYQFFVAKKTRLVKGQ